MFFLRFRQKKQRSLQAVQKQYLLRQVLAQTRMSTGSLKSCVSNIQQFFQPSDLHHFWVSHSSKAIFCKFWKYMFMIASFSYCSFNCNFPIQIHVILILARRLPQEQAEAPVGKNALVRPKQAEEIPKRSCCSEKQPPSPSSAY